MFRSILSLLSPAGPHGRLSVLIFHRVPLHADPLFPEEVDADQFDRICGWLRAWFNVLPLDLAVRKLGEGTLPTRALAITFDDGYADNHDVALPILRRHGLPATFFIATGFLDGGCMWNDAVIEAMRQCKARSLDLTELGIDKLGRLGLDDTAQRRTAIDTVLNAIKYLPAGDRLAATQRIASMAQVQASTDLMMTSEQVRGLHRGGMQIGAHTVSHPILAGLSDAAALAEIGDSKRRLEAILDEPVRLFAYPNGRPGLDFSDRTVQLAREAGFEAAVTTAKGAADAKSDMFRLPRYTPWDRSRFRFGTRLGANLWASRR